MGRRTPYATSVLAVLIGLALAFAVPSPPAARADGDPASDVLLIQNVFLPFEPPVSHPLASLLTATISRAHAAGFPIKVALIESKLDLGADPQLYGTPQRYASFLDVEISYNFEAKLLVVMPQGFGTVAAGPISALAGIHIDTAEKTDGLARAAIAAVVALADHTGHPIPDPSLPASASASSGGSSPVVLIAAAVIVAIIVSSGVVVRRRRAGAAQG